MKVNIGLERPKRKILARISGRHFLSGKPVVISYVWGPEIPFIGFRWFFKYKYLPVSERGKIKILIKSSLWEAGMFAPRATRYPSPPLSPFSFFLHFLSKICQPKLHVQNETNKQVPENQVQATAPQKRLLWKTAHGIRLYKCSFEMNGGREKFWNLPTPSFLVWGPTEEFLARGPQKLNPQLLKRVTINRSPRILFCDIWKSLLK